MSKSHKWDVRVYYEDTDAGGVIYNANYLKFCERARTEFLRSIGYQSHSLKEQYQVLIVVRHIDADFKGTAKLDDLLSVETVVTETKNASFAMQQSVFLGADMIFDMTVRLACVSLEMKPVKMPLDLLKAIKD